MVDELVVAEYVPLGDESPYCYAVASYLLTKVFVSVSIHKVDKNFEPVIPVGAEMLFDPIYNHEDQIAENDIVFTRLGTGKSHTICSVKEISKNSEFVLLATVEELVGWTKAEHVEGRLDWDITMEMSPIMNREEVLKWQEGQTLSS